MSVILLEIDQYKKVLNTLTFYGYIDRMSMNMLYTLRKRKINFEKYLPELVKTWYVLNEKSYNIKYKEDFNLLDEFAPSSKGSLKTNIEFVKALHCIRYQIEAETIKEFMPLTEKESVALIILDEIINEIQGKIILGLPEYDKAQWSDF